MLLLQIALCRVALGQGFLTGQELIDFAAMLTLLLTAWGSARVGHWCVSLLGLHAKLECGGETDLPHVVSENFSKPVNLLEAGRPPSLLCPPVRTAGRGKVLRA